MKKDLWRKITLYDYRYIVGFSVLGILTVVLAVYKFWDIPNGLSAGEISAATISGQFSISELLSSFPACISWLIGLPWTLLQMISINIFGFSTFAFRLPSVILMILSAAGLMAIACKFFKKDIAIVSGFLFVPSVIFMSLAHNGNGASMTIFLIVAALFAATFAIKCESNFIKGLAKAGICFALGALVYQPGGLFMLTFLMIISFLHPKTRLVIMSSKLTNLVIAGMIGIVLLAPLVIGLFIDAHTIISGLLFDGNWSINNITELGIVLTGVKAGFAGGLVTPIASAVFLMVSIIGLARSFEHFLSARSHLTLSLMLLAVGLTILQPSFAFLLFVPLCLFVMIGADVVIDEWNGLFPKNPYPRVLALALIVIIIFLNVCTAATHYMTANIYDSTVTRNYNQEFEAAREAINGYKNGATLVVPVEQIEFYSNLTRNTSKIDTSKEVADGVNIVLDSARDNSKIPGNAIPAKIITGSRSNDSILLWIYK